MGEYLFPAEFEGLLPSPLRRLDRSFRRIPNSGTSGSGSSGSLVGSLSRWPREAALCLRVPLVAFGLDSSSDGGWEGGRLCFETAVGEGEVVRGRLEPCRFLNP
jgi:hypothetical protein